MTVTVKTETDLIVPKSVRRRAGIKAGDRLEFTVSGGVISIIPKLPSAADEYTPAQRMNIDAQLAEARKGPFQGPFDSADKMISHLQGELKKRAARPRKTNKRF